MPPVRCPSSTPKREHLAPVTTYELDSSARDEDIMLILGKNIVLKLEEDPKTNELVAKPVIQHLLESQDLCHNDVRTDFEELVRLHRKRRELADRFIPPLEYMRRRRRPAPRRSRPSSKSGPKKSQPARVVSKEDLDETTHLWGYRAQQFTKLLLEDD